VIARAEPLTAHSLELGELVSGAPAEESAGLSDRAAAARAELSAVRDALRAGAEPAAAALFGLRGPGALAEAEARLESFARAETPRERFSAVFGGALPGASAVPAPEPGVFATAVSSPVELVGADRAAPAAWLDAIGRVRAGAGRLGEVVRRVEIARGFSAEALRVAQAPFAAGDRWIATHFEGAGGARPEGRLSMVIHAPFWIDPARPLGGLLVDAWNEPVPAVARDTAMALRFNAPNTRAPQSILLAVCPELARGWSTELLVATILDTLELARMRMQPPATITRAGQRPLVWLGQRSDQSGISFSL
jgi:hypothetical protein